MTSFDFMVLMPVLIWLIFGATAIKFWRSMRENRCSLGMLCFVSTFGYFLPFLTGEDEDLICLSSYLHSSELFLCEISKDGVQMESDAAFEAVPMRRPTIIESSSSFEGVTTDAGELS